MIRLHETMSFQQQHQYSNSTAAQPLSFDDIADFFSLPLYDAASTLGVCASVLKKICRENGLDRWPHRKFLAGKSIEEIKKNAAREKRKELAELSKLHQQSSSQQQNYELSKSQGVATPSNLQQQGTKNIQAGQALNFGHQSLMTGMSDEFKNGFPSDGLSITTIKWWGSSKSDGHEDIHVDEAETDGEDKNQCVEKPDGDNEKTEENGKLEDGIGPQGSGLLVAVRKRAAEEGREALKLGVHKGYGLKKPGRREASLLLRIFKSSIPKDWMHGSS